MAILCQRSWKNTPAWPKNIARYTHTTYILIYMYIYMYVWNMAFSCFSRIFNKVTWPTVAAATMRLQIAAQRPHKADNGGEMARQG